MMRTTLIALVLTLSLTVAAPAFAKPRSIKIGDNYFAPDSLKVAKNTKVIWRWPKYPGDVHDVKLKSGPKGVKKFHSDLSASDYSFARTLTKPGKYVVICTIHAEMRQTIRVKR